MSQLYNQRDKPDKIEYFVDYEPLLGNRILIRTNAYNENEIQAVSWNIKIWDICIDKVIC